VDINFDNVSGAAGETVDLTSVPPGTYLVQVAEVRPGFTRNGDERWGLRLVVAEGEFVGRLAAWDGLVFSTRGNARVRQIFEAMGLPASGKVSVQPTDLVGRQVFVEVRPSEYTPPGGERVKRNEVPYAGYRRVADQAADSAGSSEGDSGGGKGPAPLPPEDLPF